MSRRTITADSLPDYDEWGSDTHWGCSDWQFWHQKNTDKYGLGKANKKIISAFDDPQAPWFGVKRAECLTNSEFKKYAEKQGFWNALNEGSGTAILNDVINASSEIASNVTSGAAKISKNAIQAATFTTYLLPIAIVLVLFIGYKTLNKKLGV